ncbi:hypothetical protein FRB95_012005 [Tulasnella sp. JGI-2019a]|nr:hypothetical protein FRB95_012005 [Tulasnella sp. JGI-2019a]
MPLLPPSPVVACLPLPPYVAAIPVFKTFNSYPTPVYPPKDPTAIQPTLLDLGRPIPDHVCDRPCIRIVTGIHQQHMHPTPERKTDSPRGVLGCWARSSRSDDAG